MVRSKEGFLQVPLGALVEKLAPLFGSLIN